MLTSVYNHIFQGIFGQGYEECLEEIKQQYVIATAIGSMVGECNMNMKCDDITCTLRLLNLTLKRHESHFESM